MTHLLPALAAAEAALAAVFEIVPEAKAALPATEDYAVVRADYSSRLFDAFITYAGGGSRTGPRNQVRRAITDDLAAAFYAGYRDAGGEETEDDDETWLTQRINQELDYVDGVFDWLKEGRDAETITEPAVQARAEVWANGLDGVYAEGKLRGAANVMLTFDGDDGAESCVDCQKWKGKRHSARYWLKRGLVARNGNSNFECGRWDNCHHHFYTDDGTLYAE